MAICASTAGIDMTQEHMSDYDMKIHSNPNAQAWAKFFIHTKDKKSWRLEDIDESLMLGWFANAMMAMHDSQRTEQNFCSRCGKRTKDSTTIHTCTPPQELI
jgi:hypothetical protein